MPKWEVFKQTGGRSAKVQKVTLNARGIFTMNQIAFEAIGKPRFIELLFAVDEGLIGIRKTEDDNPYAYAVRKQGANNSYLISGKAFCEHYKIDLSYTKTFLEIVVADSTLVLDVKKVARVGKPTGVEMMANLFTNVPMKSDDDIPF